MNITAGGKVTLNPKNDDERAALHVLSALTDSDALRAHLEPFKVRVKEEGKPDVTSPANEDDYYKASILDFFKKSRDEFDIVSIVFRYKGGYVAQDGQEG